MSTIVQRRRGSTAAHAGFTGALGEITVDTDKNTAVLHNAVQAGGFPLAAIHWPNIFSATQTITPPANSENLVLSGGIINDPDATSFLLLSGEWNTSGAPVGFLVDITNTFSGALSKLFDWRVNGTSLFEMSVNGTIDIGANPAISFRQDGSAFFANLSATFLEIASDGQVLWAGGISSLNTDGSLLASGPTSFFGNTTNPDNAIAFQNPVGVGTNTLDFRTNGTLDANFLRKYNTTPFQIELAASGNLDFVIDSRNVSTGTSVRFLTNGIRDSGLQTLLFTFFDNGVFQPEATGLIRWNTRAAISSPADGVLRLTNNAQTDWTRLAFGGTTAAFPAIGRNGTNLEILGADGAGPSGLFIYNTKTSATNFERLDIQWTANVAQIWTEAGSGGGTARMLVLGTNATPRLTISAVGDVYWGPGDSFLSTDGSITVDIATELFAANVSTGQVVIGLGGAVANFDAGGNSINLGSGTLAIAGANSIGFFGAGPSPQQDAASLADNTAGGAADTIDTFAGALYTTDAPVIEGNFHQLALKVNQIITALENYGLLIA